MTNNNLSKVFTFVILILICIALAGGLYFGNKRLSAIEDLLVFPNDSSEYVIQNEVTIKDILQFREDVRHNRWVDSIYMSIPDVVLIDILVNHGTTIPDSEVVDIYLANPDTYTLQKSQQRYDGYKEFLKEDTTQQVEVGNELIRFAEH